VKEFSTPHVAANLKLQLENLHRVRPGVNARSPTLSMKHFLTPFRVAVHNPGMDVRAYLGGS
jgi:hypothetical protein